MAQTNFTPISLYYSATAAAVPSAGNLVAGELAINTADGKLFYKDSAGVVQVIGTKGGVGSSTTTQVLYNSSGLVVGSANLTFNGTTLTAGGLTTTGATSTGTFSATGVATFSAGTVSAPAITTTGDTNTGIFFPAADTIAFTEGGVESMRITSAGDVAIGTTSAVGKLNVAGQVTATGGIFKANGAPSLSAATAGEAILAPEGTLGALLYGNGSTYDVVLGRRTTNVALGVLADTVNLFAGGSIRTTNTVSVGNATPSTSGAGVTFPATQSASSDANTLDDYEEGTWTPTIQGGTTGGTTTYGSQVGWYVKVGNTVTVGFYITWSAATGTGFLLIGGLPFSAGSGSKYAAGGLMTQGLDWTGGTMATLYKPPGNSNLEIYGSGDAINWVQQTMDGAAELIGGCTYSV